MNSAPSLPSLPSHPSFPFEVTDDDAWGRASHFEAHNVVKSKPLWREARFARVYETLLGIGITYGLTTSALSIHLDRHGIAQTKMGVLATVFALGIVLSSVAYAWIGKYVSPRVALTVSVVGYASCVGAFSQTSSFGAMLAIRGLDGAFSVVSWIAAETLLLREAPKARKAEVMSYYALSIALGYVIGPIVGNAVLRLTGATTPVFVLASALALLSAVLSRRVRSNGPADNSGPNDVATNLNGSGGPLEQEVLSTKALASLVRIPCLATFAYGYFQASLILFLPLFLVRSRGISEANTILITAFFAAGMLLFSNVFARVGDRRGHVGIMRTLVLVGGSMVFLFSSIHSFVLMGIAVFIAGATLASLSPLSLAMLGHNVPERHLPRANSFYNAAYAGGMLMGPVISGLLFQRWGGEAMLFQLTALWVAFFASTWTRARHTSPC